MKRWVFVLLLLLPVQAYASDPVLLFSDLTSGSVTGWEGSATKGAAVTVWGLNLGASGTLACGGQTLSSADSNQIAEWAVTTNNASLDASTPLERITFWLNSSMSIGATTISVTTGGVTSNTLSFTTRSLGSNHIYFIAPSGSGGSDTNNGLRDTDEGGGVGPWLTIQKADPSENASVIAGDTVYIRAGTYSTQDEQGTALYWRTGGVVGTSSAPIGFIGYPGDAFPVSSISMVDVPRPGDGRTLQVDYVTISKIAFTGTQQINCISFWGDGWRMIGLNFTWSGQRSSPMSSATITPVNCENTYILGMKHVGGGFSALDHVTYWNCGYWSEYQGDILNAYMGYNEIDDFDGSVDWVQDGPGGGGFNFRTTDGVHTIDGVYVFNNYMHDSAHAWFLFTGENGNEDNYYLYNNLIVRVGTAEMNHCVIQAGFDTLTGADYSAYNNTFYECCTTADCWATICVLNSGAAKWHTKNNVMYQSSRYFFMASGGGTLDSDYDNLYGGAGNTNPSGTATITNSVTTDPSFVNIGANDFSLSPSSLSIDAGTSDVSAIVTNDLLALARPQNSLYDIGAYEYPAAGECADAGDCDDANVCTTDTCESLVCVHTNNVAACDDGLYCTDGDACSGGSCISGAARNCDDADACTDDSCNETANQCDHVNTCPTVTGCTSITGATIH